MRERTEIAVLGSGPAGWALAGRLAGRGRDVVLVAPRPRAAWTQRFGVWVDEAELPAEFTFPSVRVALGDGVVHEVERPYRIVDRPALQARLQAAAAGVRVVDATVSAVDPGPTSTRIVHAGGVLEAGVAVDATGAGTPFVRRRGVARHAQTAFGWILRTPVAVPPTWMDFSHDFGAGPATFLYAFPRGPGEVFVEETSLVSRGGVPFDLLEARLRHRLAARGIDCDGVVDVERCRIPTDLPLPDLDQPVLAFGAAASMVHPATGFQLARALGRADAVAEALDAGWSAGPARAVRDAWRVVWPADAVRRHHLYTFGARALAALDARETRAFLQRFFALAPDVWADWLGDRSTTPGLVWAMTRFYVGLRPGLAFRVPVAGLDSWWGVTT